MKVEDFPHSNGGIPLGISTTVTNGANSHGESNGIRPFHRPLLNLYPSPEDTRSYVCSWPEVVDFNATHNPDHVFCVQAERKTDTIARDNGWHEPPLLRITNAELRNAVARCGQWLQQTIPELQLPIVQDDGTVKKGDPIALFMESDVGLLLHQLALIGLGVPVLLLSARLSSTAVHSLLEKTSACAVVASNRFWATVNGALSADGEKEIENGDSNHVKHKRVPSVYYAADYNTFFPSKNGHSSSSPDFTICHPQHYFSESDRDVLILHSSGTTGLPKPIYVSHRHLLSFLNCEAFTTEQEAQGINMSTLPLYHAYGLLAPALAMSVGKTVCFPATSTVPSALSTIELIQATEASSLMSVPSILEDISLMPENQGAKVLASLDFVSFGGGLLKPSVGDKLSSLGVQILNHYGSTESGPLAPMFVPRAEDNYDWHFFRLRRDIKLEITEIASSLDENGNAQRRFKLTTFPFGWDRPFEIQDQLVCNPEHPETDFNAVGRNDDWIVLMTGEKVIPGILESMLMEQITLVKSAVVFGQQQFEIGVIIEPCQPVLGPEATDEFKQGLWPIIQRAGEKMEAHARISSMDAMVILPPGVSVPRTDKASIARNEVYRAFEKEIAQAYADLEYGARNASVNLWGAHISLEQAVKGLIQTHLNWTIEDNSWTIDDDLFTLGMDSLQATRLRRMLLSASRDDNAPPISQSIGRDFIYANPTVRRLADALRGINYVQKQDREIGISEFVRRYKFSQDKDERAIVLLTGGTGSLGSHCVAHLASLPEVKRIIILNRASSTSSSQSAISRQLHSLQLRGITLSQDQWDRIECHQVESSNKWLGLSTEDYNDLCCSITHILHASWPMDFKWKLPSFHSQFQTLQNLGRLALDAHSFRPYMKPRLLFISSIATVGQYTRVHGSRLVPENFTDTVACVNDIGYADAKLVCERIIEDSVKNHGDKIETCFVRVGQLAGSKLSGFWNKEEHLPALVKSSQCIRAFPQLEGTLSWIPVDDAAAVVSELLLSDSPPSPVCHLENPIRQAWADVLGAIASELGVSKFLPFDEWLQKVVAANQNDTQNPARALEEFFQVDFRRMACGDVILDTYKTRNASTTLAKLNAVSTDTIVGYLKYWEKDGYL